MFSQPCREGQVGVATPGSGHANARFYGKTPSGADAATREPEGV